MADFETTTDPDDCRVWGWGLCDIERAEELLDVEIGKTLQDFIDRISCEPSTVYFHNLGFDGSFIIDYLYRLGFKHSTRGRLRKGEFSTLISNMGQFYSMLVMWENGVRTEFRDSIKKLPMSVKNVGKAFKLDEAKGEIDYHKTRPVGYEPTPEECEYIATDVLIVSRALKVQFTAGMLKLTVGADSLNEFKKLTTTKVFQRMFPVLPDSMDTEIRRAYRGGFAYADPRFKGKVTGPGKVYDVNSLYPSVMYDRPLPYGEPIHVKGLPRKSDSYPLFIVSITFTARLKPGHIPCIQIKNSPIFGATEYQTNILDPVTVECTNVDLELWQDHYDLDIYSYNGGWKFHAVTGMFCKYIDKWMKVKSEHTGGMRVIAKLHLNSLYGKFATNPDVTGKMPVFEDDKVRLVRGEEESTDPVYTAMGAFITAYARNVTIRAAQEQYGSFAYADTDSLHLLIDGDHPAGLDVDKTKLGAWKHEYDFDAGLFIRAKAYSEHLTNPEPCDICDATGTRRGEPCTRCKGTGCVEQVTHIAGLPDVIADQMRFDDFIDGTTFTGKLHPKRVPGGIVLEDVGFTLNV